MGSRGTTSPATAIGSSATASADAASALVLPDVTTYPPPISATTATPASSRVRFDPGASS